MKGIIVKSLLILAAVGFFTSCAVIREGEVGVKRRFGKYDDRPYTQGLRVFNPFTSVIVKVPVRTEYSIERRFEHSVGSIYSVQCDYARSAQITAYYWSRL